MDKVRHFFSFNYFTVTRVKLAGVCQNEVWIPEEIADVADFFGGC